MSQDPVQSGTEQGAGGTIPDRRKFLQQCCAGIAAVAACRAEGLAAAATDGPAGPTNGPRVKLPTIRIGPYELTRLIAGGNPIEGYSHSSVALSRHMKEYFTLAQTVEFVSRCQASGINAWQTGHGPSEKVLEALRILRERGSEIHWFCLSSETRGNSPAREIVAHRPIAVVHHGGVTDSCFRDGRRDKVHDYVKRVHDCGVLAGVSTHNPANLAFMEEKGWENDFFMACLYQVSRPKEEIRRKLGTIFLDEPFLESDRDEMTAVIRKVRRPCLAFKILAAGRLCRDPASVESAFQYAFRGIKETDGVIVGMYPRFSDEIAANVRLALKYGVA